MDQTQERQFEKWWAAIAPGVQRVVSRLTGLPGNDTLQDVAVLALRNWTRFSSYEDFARWCYVRAKWLALDELARRRVRAAEPIETVEAELVAPPDDWPALAEILQFVGSLPPQQRNVAVYRLMGYSSEEISRKMGIAVNTVRSHWRFALQTLSTRTRES
jgi:RNA polymerase sigma factor (sigma-70 family)